MATVPPPPPPPPVGRPAVQYSQSHLHGTSSSLPRSERPSTNSNNVGSVRSSAATPNKRPFADVDDATLQRAAQRLRKTGNYEQILSSQPISSQGMGRQAELPVGGYRQNSSEYATVAEHPTGKPVYAQDPSPYASTAIGQHHGYPVPIIQQQSQTPGQQNYSSSSSSYTTTQTTNYNSVQPPPLPTSFPPPSFGLSQQFPAQSFSPAQNAYSSQTTYHYVDPQNYTIKETYQSQPTNNNGIQTYKTYTSTTTNSYTDSNQQQPTEQQNINQQQLPSSINNPQKYLYDFATRTPIAVLSPEQQQINNNSDQSSSYSYSYSSTNNNSVPGPKQPLTYAEELRNSSLTSTQQQYNQYQKSQLPERQIPGSFHQLYEESIRANKRTDQVDDLVKDMEARLRTGIRDICAKCNTPIVGDTPGVTALGKPYHVNCFSCDACQKQLAGCSFYNVDGKNLCQVDYMNSLEKCSKCATPITQKILRALGQAFHPECFVCPSCQKSLDGIPFTVTKENSAYCLDCYHEKFSPRCAACLKAIAPSGNETEVARVIAMDKSYHVACYRCEDCGLQLNSKVEGAACYPLESHLFCRNCNLNRLKATC